MKKKKILFFIPQLSGGGAEKVSITLMKMLDKNIFEVHMATITLDGLAYRYLSNDIVLHDLNVKKTIFSIFKLRNLILSLEPDIIYSSLIRGSIAITLALLNLKEKPFVVLRSPNSPKLLVGNKQMKFYERYLLEFSYKKANLLLAQTPEMKEEISFYHKIEKNKIQVLLNPLDIEGVENNIKDITNPFENDFVNIVAAGRITYQKGFDILIRSFRQVVEKNPLFRLYIIGEEEGNEIEKLKMLITELKLNEYVFFLGYQKNAYRYFYFSDLYVLSSRWEGLPNTVLENLYLKKPVIATRCIPFMDSLIENGKNGFLVEVENVDELAKAILDYKNLRLEFSMFKDSTVEINNLFKSLEV